MKHFTILQARLLSGMTQREIMEHLGIKSEKTYINYEKYHQYFRMDQAVEFAKAVRLPFNSIIFYDKCTDYLD